MTTILLSLLVWAIILAGYCVVMYLHTRRSARRDLGRMATYNRRSIDNNDEHEDGY